jgi:hypothetical protein
MKSFAAANAERFITPAAGSKINIAVFLLAMAKHTSFSLFLYSFKLLHRFYFCYWFFSLME